MRRLLVISLLALLPFLFAGAETAVGQSHLTGKVIALDAGHGGNELGATYPANAGWSGLIYEKDLNLEVVESLRDKLVAAGANVVLTREGDQTIASRKERVDIAVQKCKSLYGKTCDALVSVHHNGSTDPAYDGTLVIYNERQDLALARPVHDALKAGLPHPPAGCAYPYSYTDEGLRNGGYGMTVYGHLVSILTEAYYITNQCYGETLLNAAARTGLIDQEANAILAGMETYFGSQKTKPRR